MEDIESIEDIEMNEESFSNSAEGSSDSEDVDEEKTSELEQKLEVSPYTYDLHVHLVSLYRKAGDLDKLRNSRERMHKIFPLSPELWLDWLTDEKTLATTKEQKEELLKLFDRAVKDYTSVSVWMEYVQYSIGQVSEGWDTALESIREVFERATTAVGIHVSQGYLVWAAYQELESLYLLHLKNKNAASEDVKKQEDRIFNLFKRQLSVPLIDMEKVYLEFKEFCTDSMDTVNVDYSYNKALKKLGQLLPFEELLDASEPPHYEEYKKYIQHEKEDGEPVRIQSIYERAIVDNCLKDDLWLDYTKFVDQIIKMKEISLPLHERAVRNCPWSAQLWVNYGRASEHYDQSHKIIIDIFEAALEMGFSNPEDFQALWLAYLDYLRRKLTVTEQVHDCNFTEIEALFNRAITHMNTYFWGTEAEYAIYKYWIFFNAKYKKDIENCRKYWKDLISHGHQEAARVWLDYADFERHGDSNHYRKILFQALCCVSEWPEAFSDLLITFEREEGTLESLEKSLARCQTQLKFINEKRQKKLAETTTDVNEDFTKGFSKRQRQVDTFNKKTVGGRVQMDSEGFKIPPVPGRVGSDNSDFKEYFERKRKMVEKESYPDPKKKKIEVSESHGTNVKHDASKDDRTVFISNLSYKLEEDSIQTFFAEFGEIEEIRLVRDFKGRSKGFCYVVYKSEKCAKCALSKDRSLLEGRPVLISPCKDKKNTSSVSSAFKFGTGLERNKLFVKSLPFSITKEELENMFKECGKLKDVRLVTYRNGHPKGLAYVEYEDEADAANAIVKMDGHQIQDHVISVAISHPPPRKPRREFSGDSLLDSLGGGSFSARGPRGRGRTQISLLPRSVVRPPSSAQKLRKIQNGQSGDTQQNQLSNSDFAKMLKQ